VKDAEFYITKTQKRNNSTRHSMDKNKHKVAFKSRDYSMVPYMNSLLLSLFNSVCTNRKNDVQIYFIIFW
jgi:hypothetical protein